MCWQGQGLRAAAEGMTGIWRVHQRHQLWVREGNPNLTVVDPPVWPQPGPAQSTKKSLGGRGGDDRGWSLAVVMELRNKGVQNVKIVKCNRFTGEQLLPCCRAGCATWQGLGWYQAVGGRRTGFKPSATGCWGRNWPGWGLHPSLLNGNKRVSGCLRRGMNK